MKERGGDWDETERVLNANGSRMGERRGDRGKSNRMIMRNGRIGLIILESKF